MKKIITLLIYSIFTLMVSAQPPEKVSYQAIIRDASNNLLINQNVGIEISILQGGITVYSETHSLSTNGNGLLTLEIGGGMVSVGSMSAIDWANGPYFIKTEIDPAGGTNYTITHTSELLSVPYALHANTADSVVGGIAETDPVYLGDPAATITSADITDWNSKLSSEVDGSVTNELQALSISNDTVYLSSGGYVKLPAGFDGQYSSLSGTPTNVSDFTNDAGYLTTEVDGSVTNEIQSLSFSNDTLTLSESNSVYLGSTGGNSPWETANANDLYYDAGRVKIGQTQNATFFPAHLTVGDTGQASLMIGHAGNFNEINSGKIVFAEDVNYGAGCGFEIQHNGAANTLSVLGGCSALDTIIVFTREGNVRIPEGLMLGGDGLTNPGATLDLMQDGSLTSSKGIKFRALRSSTDQWNIGVDGSGNFGFMYNGSLKGSINSSTGAYATSSDRTLKTNITSMPSVLDRVLQLRPTRYQYNDTENGDYSFGFIAQEVQPLFPEAVTVAGNEKLALFYNYFTVIGIKAIQEQNEIIKNQQQEIDELKTMLQQLEKRLEKLEE